MPPILFCALFISIVGILKSEISIAKNLTEFLTHNCTSGSYNLYRTIDRFPNPQKDIGYCGRGCKSSWICDPGHSIGTHEADNLDKSIDRIKQLEICNCSSCIKGKDVYSIFIAIVPQAYLRGNDTSSDIHQQAEDFVQHIRKEWQVGSCGSNVVILLSGSLIKSSVGPVVRSFIFDRCKENVEHEAFKILLHENPALALSFMVKRFSEIFEHQQCLPPIPPPGAEGLPSEALIAGIGVFLILLGYGGYMVKKDLSKKARLQEEKLKKSSHSRRKRKPSLALLNARRKSQIKSEEALKLKKIDANINIIITNEEGTDITTDQ